MRTLASFITLVTLGACHDLRPDGAQRLDEDSEDQSPAPSAYDGYSCDLRLDDYSVDVRCDDFGVDIGQLPDLANPEQPISWFGYGCGHDGDWQGTGCFTAIPYELGDDFVGMAQTLPDNGLLRLSCGITGGVDNGALDPDDDSWCKHSEGIDSSYEDKWMIDFMECGVVKTNLCIKRIQGVSYPAEAECFAQYVPPPSCPS